VYIGHNMVGVVVMCAYITYIYTFINFWQRLMRKKCMSV